jgi:hypothetical protein
MRALDVVKDFGAGLIVWTVVISIGCGLAYLLVHIPQWFMDIFAYCLAASFILAIIWVMGWAFRNRA